MAAKTLTIGGIGAQPTLDDVVKIAQGGITVALDAAGAERIKKESPPPKSFQPESFEPASESNAAASAQLLDVPQTRAVMAMRLFTIMNGRSGTRVQVAEFLVSLLTLDQVNSETPQKHLISSSSCIEQAYPGSLSP